jgi:exopolysaccharide production protein ExoQ
VHGAERNASADLTRAEAQALDRISLSMLPTVVCILFIVYLFWMDLRRPDSPSQALWVPLAWMFLAGSRYVSSWLGLTPTFAGAGDFAEGSPIDRAVFFALIVAGILILARRKIDWQRLLLNNVWIILYFLYCLASMAWADEPTLLMKRWVKDLGNPIMALVILTERRPYEAVGAVLRRLAFLLLPLSVLFIKYYPELGRDYKADGTPMYTGVGHQKNDLGLMCLLAGIYLFWELLQGGEKTRPPFTRQHKIVAVVLIGMIAWLLHMSDSQTSFVCLVAAVLLLLLGRMRFVARRPGRTIGVLLCAVLAIWLLDEVLHVQELALSLLGRNPNLTNRTDIWQTLGGFEVNPIVGAGFMSFWSGARLEELWTALGARLNQAHNGYLEQYLNLGYIGVAFIAVILLSGLLRVRRHLSVDPAAGMLRLCFIVTAVLYNYTEASFYGINNMWMLLLLGCLEVPRQRQPRAGDNSPSKQPLMQGKAGIRHRQRPPRAQAERSYRRLRPPGLDVRGSQLALQARSGLLT